MGITWKEKDKCANHMKYGISPFFLPKGVILSVNEK